MKIKKNNKIFKPWGFEVLLEKNNIYVLKKLFMKKNHRCSLQYHKKKLETIYVLSGILEISFGKSKNNRSYNLSEEITLTVEFIKRLNLENYYIIAYSLGGIIALQYLLQEIKLVKKLVLINTPLTLMNINRNRRLYLILRYYLGFILPFKLLAKIICFNLFSDNRKFAHIFYQQIISSDRKTYKNIVKDLKYYDVINQLNKENKINLLAQLNKKILYIYGNKDQLIDGNTQLKISKAIHHKLIEGNHGLFLEKQVKEVSKTSLNFFTKIN